MLALQATAWPLCPTAPPLVYILISIPQWTCFLTSIETIYLSTIQYCNHRYNLEQLAGQKQAHFHNTVFNNDVYEFRSIVSLHCVVYIDFSCNASFMFMNTVIKKQKANILMFMHNIFQGSLSSNSSPRSTVRVRLFLGVERMGLLHAWC